MGRFSTIATVVLLFLQLFSKGFSSTTSKNLYRRPNQIKFGNRTSNNNKVPRIVGGYPSTALYGQFLVYLSIVFDNGEGFSCTGSALSANRVLYAAHCFIHTTDDGVVTGSPLSSASSASM